MLVLINVCMNAVGLILMAALALGLFMLAYELFTWRLKKAKWGRKLVELNGRLAKLEALNQLDWLKRLSEKDIFKKTGAAQVSKAPRVTRKLSKRPFKAVVKVNQVSER